eukprot:2846737-Pleurochrysis_carterae.AAC.1
MAWGRFAAPARASVACSVGLHAEDTFTSTYQAKSRRSGESASRIIGSGRDCAMSLPVTAVCALQNNISLAGIGPDVRMYIGKQLVLRMQVLRDEAVHHIAAELLPALQAGDAQPGADEPASGMLAPRLLIIAHGIREACAMHVRTGSALRLLSVRMRRRILAGAFVHTGERALLSLACDDNSVRLWRVAACATPTAVCTLQCAEQSVLYAFALRTRALMPMLAAAGSAFMAVTVWDASPSADARDAAGCLVGGEADLSARVVAVRPVLLRLEGHCGSVFALSWSPLGDTLLRRVERVLWTLSAPSLPPRPPTPAQARPRCPCRGRGAIQPHRRTRTLMRTHVRACTHIYTHTHADAYAYTHASVR